MVRKFQKNCPRTIRATVPQIVLSLIDLILTNNVNRLIYSGVVLALTDQIRYHCPVIGFIDYPKTPTKPFKRKIWLYEHADYEKLRQNLFNI